MWFPWTKVKLDDPISTMETFQKALDAKKWKAASECLSEEIRRENAAFLDLPIFYSTHYWSQDRGVESLLAGPNGPPLLRRKTCRFKRISQEQSKATVEVFYPDLAEKSVRLRSVTLIKGQDGQWKIAELFGKTKGRLPEESQK